MGVGGIIGLVAGLLFGVILLAVSFFCSRSGPRQKVGDGSGSKRSSAMYAPLNEKDGPLKFPDGPILRVNSGRPINPGPPMTTFGPNICPDPSRPLSIEDSVKLYLGDQVDVGLSSGVGELVRITPLKGEVDYSTLQRKARPDITLSSASLASSADTDDLSTLGVQVSRPRSTDFPDPLGSWDDLEPELNNRRSRNLELELDFTQTDISLTGPTGYPVLLPSPSPSPIGGSRQRLHYHYPEGRRRSTERGRSLERAQNGRARTPTHL